MHNMIAYLQGLLLEKTPEYAIVIAGGVGYKVYIPLTTFYSMPSRNEPIELFVQTVVRDDSIRLFGFRRDEERKMFELFLTVSGIGPKLALNIMSGMEFESLKQAVLRQDSNALSSIPGFGKKSAEKLLFELKGKSQTVSLLGDRPSVPGTVSPDSTVRAVVSTLTNLGYKQLAAEKAALEATEELGGEVEMQMLIRRALKIITGRKK
ncbi:Holliday junction branch migration protein RuvA [bacterium]|nr:Holliday junction branch migration protein RuvA [candidate division CSSED10-310 bacterium]